MNGFRDHVYGHAPYPIQNLLISAYGQYLKSIRYGSAYLQFLATIEKAADLSGKDLAGLQADRLTQLIRGAVSHVPYYRSRYRHLRDAAGTFTLEDLTSHFPILEKREVREYRQEFVSEAVPQRRRITVFTSGTTGTPLEVAATKPAVAENFAFFSHFLRQHGIDPFAWSATFAGRLIVPKSQHGPPFWRCNYPMRTWLFSSYHIGPATIPAYLAQLERVGPAYIDSYPSSIYAISRYIVEKKLRHSMRLRAIVTSSEVLTRLQREVIEEAFRCPVLDQYGSAEMVVFAAQCESGSYHLHPLYGITEIVNERGQPCGPGEPGDLVVTGLINDAMPLIRYRIGDCAAFRAAPCPCGSAYPALNEVLGREDDYIVTPEGNFVGRLDPLFKGLRGLVEAQVVQESPERIDVLVVPSGEFDDNAQDSLIRSLRERVGDRMEILVRPVEAIPRAANGKFRTVISRVQGASMR